MKLCLHKDDGQIMELKEIKGIDKENDIIVFQTRMMLPESEIKRMEGYLSNKFNKKCIVLDSRVIRVFGL